jgi:hypothetical protein
MHHDETRWMTAVIEVWCLLGALVFAAVQSI